MEKVLALLRRALSHRSLVPTMGLVAVLVTLPALWEPLSTDDLIIRDKLLAPSAKAVPHYASGLVPPGSDALEPAVMDLFTWVGPGRKAEARSLIASGSFHWWASEQMMLAFWRPLSSFTHWLDFQIWPDSVVAMHLHGLAWFAAVMAALTLLYRRLLAPAWIAGLAAVAYAIDENFFFPVAWLSNRNVLLAMLFGILCLLAHDAWRRHGSLAGAWLAPPLLLLALLGGEPGVAFVGYLAAYALCLDRAGWLARGASLLPAFAVTVGWRLVYQALDYGAFDIGFYLDPGREPLRFLGAVAERAPILLLGQLGWPSPDSYEYLSPEGRRVMWAAAVAILIGLLGFFWPLLRREASARFWALGMLAAVLPVCATSPLTGRRLFFVGVGAMALTAQYVGGVLDRADWRPRRRLLRWGTVLVAVGLFAFQIVRPLAFVALRYARQPQAALSPDLDLGSDPALTDQEVILVSAPNTFLLVYMPWERQQRGQPVPRGVRLLAPAFATLELTRSAERELELRPRSGSLMAVEPPPRFDLANDVYGMEWSNHGFWGDRFPLAAGDRRELPGLTVEVLDSAADGFPSAVSFRFSGPLEDPGRRWLYWDWPSRRYRQLALPAVGETAELPGPFATNDAP